MKTQRLSKLVNKRQTMRLDDYDCIGDFHDGVFECDFVSPITKSGHNVDAEVMVVLQDWSSSDVLGKTPPDLDGSKFGYTPSLPTNKNLDALLDRHFGLVRAECYLTNLFPFVKAGGISASIPMKDLVTCAQKFTIPEIQIVAPRLVVCLGLRTFLALMRAHGLKGTPKMDEAVNSPFNIEISSVNCVAHTGALGMNNRGRSQVEKDWKKVSESI